MSEEALFAHLSLNAGVKALVADRIIPRQMDVDPSKLPAITYSRVSTPRTLTHSGRCKLIVGARFQFSAWAATYDEAKVVAKAAINCLHGYRGLMGGITNVGMCRVDNELDDTETTAELNRRMFDVVMNYEEAA